MFTKGTFAHSVERGVLVFATFAVTTLMASNPEWGTITVGSLAFTIIHWMSSKLET